MTSELHSNATPCIIRGRRVALGRRLVVKNRRDWKRLIKQHGGHPIDQLDELTDVLLVSGDDDGAAFGAQNPDHLDLQRLKVVAEDELYQMLAQPESDVDLSRLYTPQILAKLLDVPVATVRRWHRRGLINPVHQINKLPYFDFQEIASARRIARWIQSGQSPASIERQLAEIAKTNGDQRPLSQLSIIVEGQKVLLRAGQGLSAANGQLHFNFENDLQPSPSAGHQPRLKIAAPDSDWPDEIAGETDEDTTDDYFNDGGSDGANDRANQSDDRNLLPNVLPFVRAEDFSGASFSEKDFDKSPDQFIHWATELEDQGDVTSAVEVYRTMALAHGISPDINFRIAELLYQAGDLSAARERYYSAIELDETFVEARASLGCVLVDLGQHDLAIAAFKGALDYHRNFADVHFHLARLLDETGKPDDATTHWEAFLDLAPKSPWAEEARQRMRRHTDLS